MIRCKAVIVLLAARITADLRSLGYTVADPGPPAPPRPRR